MGKIVVMIMSLAVLIFAHLPAYAQMNIEDEKEIVIEFSEASRKATISANLNFSEKESKAFCPVYNQYRKDIKAVNEALIKLIEKFSDKYNSLSDSVATDLMLEAMSIEEDRMILKQVYVADLVEILPMIKVLKLYQIENKLEALLRVALAETVPFVKMSDEAVSKKAE